MKKIKLLCCCYDAESSEQSTEQQNNKVPLKVITSNSSDKINLFNQSTDSPNILIKKAKYPRENTIDFKKPQDYGESSGRVTTNQKDELYRDSDESSNSLSVASDNSEKNGTYISKSKLYKAKSAIPKNTITNIEESSVENDLAKITNGAQTMGDDGGWLV